MPDWILLLPILFPLAGALVFTLVAPHVSPRARVMLPLIFLIVEIIAILVNIAPGLHALAFSDWSSAALSIAFHLDGVTLLLLLTLFVPLGHSAACSVRHISNARPDWRSPPGRVRQSHHGFCSVGGLGRRNSRVAAHVRH